MRIKILGCGTSTGVPVPGCQCEVCTSIEPKNTRLRTSALIELQEKDLPENSPILSPLRQESADPERVLCRVLIDTGPDLRFQLLREDVRSVDAVLYTHTHADHIFGIDDLRGICFSQGYPILAYTSEANTKELKQYFPYIFDPDPEYLGGAPPKIDLKVIQAYSAFELFGVPVVPLPVLHGKLEILGFRIGSFAYLTDCSAIPVDTKSALQGLDVLCLSGLRSRPHPTHLSLDEACREILSLAPKRAYLIHLSHDVDYSSENARLATVSNAETGPLIELAYDGLQIAI